MSFSRVVMPAACLLAAALYPALPHAQAPTNCVVGGAITSGRTPLPGVVVSILGGDGHVFDVSASAGDGTYALKIPDVGRYTLTAEFAAFAPLSRELTIDTASCQQRVDLVMTLASRAPQSVGGAAAAPAAPIATTHVGGRGQATAPGGRQAQSGRGQGGRQQGTPQQFQSLALLADDAGLARSDDAAGNVEDGASPSMLPPGFSPDTSAESVTATGTSQPTQGFFGPNGPGQFADRFGGAFGGGDGAGGAAGPGGQTGFAGGGPGGGRGFGGPGGPGGAFGRGGRGNQIRGSFYQSFDTSAFDAAPFPLNGQATTKPDYLQQRFGATVGGPLVIPKVINSPRTFFFVNYTGNHSSNPYDAYSTVPTAAERAGDLSGIGKTVVDPYTRQPFPNNQIPAALLNPAAVNLLNLIPLPNQSGSIQNFHDVTTVSTQLDDINLRLVHTFGAAPQGRRGQGGGGRGGFGGGRGGRGQPGVSNLNITIHYRRSDNESTNPFPTLGGTSAIHAWDVPATYSFTKAGMLQSMRFDVNRQQSQSQNLYAFGQNIAGQAGLLGVSSDPFDWGAPNLSFSSIQSVRDTSPSSLTNQTISVGDTITKITGQHTTRFGGDFRSIHADSRTDANARGSYVFTGLYTGSDVGDFLLGQPQQASKQFGPGLEQFRSTSWDFFVQDDWRLSDKVTLNAGLRYEYYSPVSEASNRLATLDVAPGFTAAVPVQAGGTGPFSGTLPDTIVNPFRTGFAPRVGLAWRVKTGTVVRAGYGINYNAGVYQTIAQQLAGQPPFASTATITTASPQPLLLEQVLAPLQNGQTTNTYAVDPNYRLPWVQIWNVDLQRDLSRTVQLGVGYTGTKGSDLDLLRAPNRTPTGLLIPGVQPFIFESSQAYSFMNALTVRLRKRLTDGLAVSGTYTLSKSIDDASSIAGNGGTVAQNDQDLGAERSFSNFDQRHRFQTDFTYELPFGPNKRWLTSGAPSALFGNWIFNGTLQLASGMPLTPRLLGNVTDVARGVNGTLRTNYNGQPIAISDPTVAEFFNTAAFSPPAPGTFGNAGRNIIIGPGTSNLNLGLTRNIVFGQSSRGLSVQILASNLLNDVQFASVDTNFNSPTFGQVTGVRAMRRLQILTRLRF